MFAVGGVLLIVFGLYEKWGTNHPILPYRILNKVFILGVIIGASFEAMSDGVELTIIDSHRCVLFLEWKAEIDVFLELDLCHYGLVSSARPHHPTH